MSVCDEEELLRLGISREEKDKLVAEVIRHVLFKTFQSSGCPIKREDLTQLITKNYRQYTLPSLILNEAKEKLLSIFGYEMKELQRSRASSTKQARSSQQDAKSYVITSRLPSDIYCKFVEDKGTCHASGFAFVVLGIIHLGGGQISEENLWQHLKRVGLNESDENHPVFGNIKQALEALVQQRYLQKDKINGPEGNTMMYGLAERALDEAVSKKLKDYIAQANMLYTAFNKCILRIRLGFIAILIPRGPTEKKIHSAFQWNLLNLYTWGRRHTHSGPELLNWL